MFDEQAARKRWRELFAREGSDAEEDAIELFRSFVAPSLRDRDLLDTARAIVLQSMAMGVTTSHESVRTAVRLARTMLDEIATPTPEPPVSAPKDFEDDREF